MQTEIPMKDTGKMIRLMVMVLTSTLTVRHISVPGKRTNNMDRGRSHGRMELNMKATI